MTIFLTMLFFSFLQTTISVQFKSVSVADKYQLEYKRFEQDWASATSITLVPEGGLVKGEAVDLEPGATYCLRVYCIASDGTKGAPGNDLIVDTEQVGCTPQAEKSCCVIQ